MLIAINFGKYNKVTDIRPDFPFPDKKNVMQGYVRFKPAFTSFLVSASYTTLKVAEVISDPYMKLNFSRLGQEVRIAVPGIYKRRMSPVLRQSGLCRRVVQRF